MPLAVRVSIAYNGIPMGESGVLSGAVGQAPQVRLLSAPPTGWSVRIDGPCREGAATTVCTLDGAQGGSSITVQFVPPPSGAGSPAITIGLFAAPGDAVPVDSF